MLFIVIVTVLGVDFYLRAQQARESPPPIELLDRLHHPVLPEDRAPRPPAE